MRETEIILLLDRSGSMSSIREATISGINKLMEDVRKEPGRGYWTLLQFDDMQSAKGAKEDFPLVSFERISDEFAPRMETFVPRGSTALIDAACMTIMKTKERVLQIPKETRPRVMIVIITDGQENASVEFTRGRLRELTAEVQKELDWQFMYIGANQDAFAESSKIGIPTVMRTYAGAQHCNKVDYAHNSKGFGEAMVKTSGGLRGWKAEGNQTAEQLLSSAEPEPKEVKP